MHVDPEKVGRAIASIGEKLGIQSDGGKLLFGVECLLAFVLIFVIVIFAFHDVVMVIFTQHGGEAMEALKWTLVVFVFSMVCVLIRERLVK